MYGHSMLTESPGARRSLGAAERTAGYTRASTGEEQWSQQILTHSFPVRELFASEMDPLAFELLSAVGRPVVYQVVPTIQVFVMGQDQALVRHLGQVPMDPFQLVLPGSGVLPRSST